MKRLTSVVANLPCLLVDGDWPRSMMKSMHYCCRMRLPAIPIFKLLFSLRSQGISVRNTRNSIGQLVLGGCLTSFLRILPLLQRLSGDEPLDDPHHLRNNGWELEPASGRIPRLRLGSTCSSTVLLFLISFVVARYPLTATFVAKTFLANTSLQSFLCNPSISQRPDSIPSFATKESSRAGSSIPAYINYIACESAITITFTNRDHLTIG